MIVEQAPRWTFRSALVTLWIAIAGILGSCAPLPRGLPTAVAAPSTAPLTISVGDQVAVSFYRLPNLDTVQVVRPDGVLALQLVGEVPAAGLTPAALRARLVELYTEHLRRPSELTVVVKEFATRRVFVGGAVTRPGGFALAGRMSLLEAVMSAGGFDAQTAEPANVLVIRHRNGKRYAGAFDLSPGLLARPGGARCGRRRANRVAPT